MLVHCTDPHFVTLANLRDLHAAPPPPPPIPPQSFRTHIHLYQGELGSFTAYPSLMPDYLFIYIFIN